MAATLAEAYAEGFQAAAAAAAYHGAAIELVHNPYQEA